MKRLFLLLALLTPAGAFAQTATEWGARASVEANYKISKGVHVYADSDVVLSANSAWLMLHTREAGDYEIALPRRARKITEITTEKPVAENADRFTWKLPKYSTAVFLLEH